jgi:hypothetical protein
MKKIGQGWQYTTYDLKNGRVLKKFHSWPKAYFVILREIFPFKNDSFFKIPSFIKEVKDRADDSFELLKRKNIPQEWMANPRFVSKYNFEQDKVTPLHDLFEKLNIEESKKIIDKFINFNKKILEIGVIDKSFNITKNYGINVVGNIVLIDIGELYDNRELIDKQFKDRAWDKSYVSGCLKYEETRQYFIQEMDKNFYKE